MYIIVFLNMVDDILKYWLCLKKANKILNKKSISEGKTCELKERKT